MRTESGVDTVGDPIRPSGSGHVQRDVFERESGGKISCNSGHVSWNGHLG